MTWRAVSARPHLGVELARGGFGACHRVADHTEALAPPLEGIAEAAVRVGLHTVLPGGLARRRRRGAGVGFRQGLADVACTSSNTL